MLESINLLGIQECYMGPAHAHIGMQLFVVDSFKFLGGSWGL